MLLTTKSNLQNKKVLKGDYIFTFLVPEIIVILAILVISVIASGYIFIVFGYRRDPKILIGRAGIKIPFLERKRACFI